MPRARTAQDVLLVEREEALGLVDPVGHQRLLPALGAELGEVEEHRREPVELGDLGLGQIVLRDSDVLLADALARPGGEPEGWGACVASPHDEFGRRAPGDREEQLVLDGGEEAPRRVRGAVVVRACREDIEDLLVEALLRRPDVPNPGQQLVEVVRAGGILEPEVVECEALDEELAQHRRDHWRNWTARGVDTR